MDNVFAQNNLTNNNVNVNDNVKEKSEQTEKKQKPQSNENSKKTKTVAPKRTLPDLILEILKHKIPVTLTDKGYEISGFYGLNRVGVAELFDTELDGQMITYDNRKHEHIIKTFDDLVKFNAHIWKAYFNEKKGEYLEADDMWSELLIKHKCVRNVPL